MQQHTVGTSSIDKTPVSEAQRAQELRHYCLFRTSVERKSARWEPNNCHASVAALLLEHSRRFAAFTAKEVQAAREPDETAWMTRCKTQVAQVGVSPAWCLL